MMLPTIIIYTDGSCHTQQQIGAWSAIILVDDEKIILSGIETNTTH
jgi:ribonuclease HI